MKIAYVEDDSDSLRLFSGKFKQDGLVCDAYSNAEEALVHIQPGSYDILIADIRLGGMSGVELLSKLRQRHVHTPCVLITAFSDLALTKRALNANADYLLEKPFTYKNLLQLVRKIVLSPGSLQHRVDRGLERIELTEREDEIARLILKGLSNGEIAKAAALSEKTVKQYVTQIFEKATVESRAEFFSYIFPL